MAQVQSIPTAIDDPRVAHIQVLLGLSQAELAEVLELSPSTLRRRPLEGGEQERLRILERLTALATQVVTPDYLPRWLSEPKPAMDDDVPRELLRTEDGRRRLEWYLTLAVDGGGA